MTKQEKIREGMARQLYYWLTRVYTNEDNFNETTWEAISEKDRGYYREYYADPLMKSLHSQGVVIKVKDRELPEIPDKVTDKFHRVRWIQAQQDMFYAGYVAVEPLIKDDK